MSDIWKERGLLDKERRDLITKLMEPYEEYFRQKKKDLMDRCELEGHNFSFSHLGSIGHVWSYCSKCGKSKVEE